MSKSSQDSLIVPDDALATLRRCRGYYECPKDPEGRRHGLLVAYAGTDDQDKHYVGEVYLNAARLERQPRVLHHCAKLLVPELQAAFGEPHWVMGVPEGGRSLALLLAIELGCEYIYPEKGKVKGADERDESVMRAGRHEIEAGTVGVLVEDVCNNFSSTGKVIDLVEKHGANVSGIACLFNRSPSVHYDEGDRFLPVVCLNHLPLEQFRQDDPRVADDVRDGNIVWDVKANWEQLETIMINAEQRRDGVANATG